MIYTKENKKPEEKNKKPQEEEQKDEERKDFSVKEGLTTWKKTSKVSSKDLHR
ncbi:MAG: hypothetical protein ACTSUC_03345 [Promethearchaeota archaeon]